MATSKKRAKEAVADQQSDLIDENEMASFADIISQSVLERKLSENDAFELYAHQLRVHLHINKETFKKRFSDGYRILVEELNKEPVS